MKIKSLRINGPSCPVCRGLDLNFHSNDDNNSLNDITQYYGIIGRKIFDRIYFPFF